MGKAHSSPQLISLLSNQYTIHPHIPNTIIHTPTQQLQTLKIIPTHSSSEQSLYNTIITQYQYNKCRSVPRLLKSHKHKKDNRFNDYCTQQINYYFIFEGCWQENLETNAGKFLVDQYMERKRCNEVLRRRERGFGIQEIWAILCCMLCGTREYYREFKRQNWQIDINMVYIDKLSNYALTLIDPLFYKQQSKLKPQCKYPAPQTLASFKRSRLIQFDQQQQQPQQFNSQLYTIGAIALQLLTMQERNDIYKNKANIQKYLRDQGYWSNQARQVTGGIQEEKTKKQVIEGIRKLLSEDPHSRTQAYNILNIICNQKYCLQTTKKIPLQNTHPNNNKINNSILKIKNHILMQNIRVRNSPIVKQMRFPVTNIHMHNIQILKNNNQYPTINNKQDEQYIQLNKSISINKTLTANSSQYFNRYLFSSDANKTSTIYPIDLPKNIHALQNRKVQSVKFDYKSNQFAYNRNYRSNVSDPNNLVESNSGNYLYFKNMNMNMNMNNNVKNNKYVINPFNKKNVVFNYTYPDNSLIMDSPTKNKQHNLTNKIKAMNLPSLKTISQRKQYEQSVNNSTLKKNPQIKTNQYSSFNQSSSHKFIPTLTISSQNLFHNINLTSLQPNNKSTINTQLHSSRYNTLSSSPPKITHSIIKQVSPLKDSPNKEQNNKIMKFSLRKQQNVFVDNLAIDYGSSSDSYVEQQQQSRAVYSLKPVIGQNNIDNICQHNIDDDNLDSKIRESGFKNLRDSGQYFRQQSQQSEDQEIQLPVIKNVEQVNSKQYPIDMLDGQLDIHAITKSDNFMIKGVSIIAKSIQYGQQQLPHLQPQQHIKPQHDNPTQNPNQTQPQKSSTKQSQKSKLIKKKSSIINQLLDQQSSIRSPQSQNFPELKKNQNRSQNDDEIDKKFIKYGESQHILSDQIFGDMPIISINALQDNDDDDVEVGGTQTSGDNQQLALSLSDSLSRKPSKQPTKQQIKKKVQTLDFESAVSIDLEQQAQKQTNIPQKDRQQQKKYNTPQYQQRSRPIRLTPPHYTSTIVQQQAQDDQNNNSNQNKSEQSQKFEEQLQQDLQFVVEEYQTGSRYEGFKLNNIRTGMGKFYYQDGGHYDGEWKNNQMHGWGKLYYESGQLAYEGYWVNDQFHGYGKVYNDDPKQLQNSFDYTNFDLLGDSWFYYQGNLIRDTKQGRGRILLTNGQVFQGDFYKDRIQGFGKFLRLDGLLIQGIWRDSRLIKVISTDESGMTTKK